MHRPGSAVRLPAGSLPQYCRRSGSTRRLRPSQHQLLGELREVVKALCRDRPDILEPDTTRPGIVEARFDGDHVAGNEFLPGRADRRELVHLQSHSVPEVMDKAPGIALVPPLREKVDHGLVYVRGRHAGFYLRDPDPLSLAEGTVHLADLAGRLTFDHGTGHICILYGFRVH